MCLTVFKAVMDLGRGGEGEEENNNDRKLIRRPLPSDPDKWNALPPVPVRTEMGYLHLSFEYHRGALRVRVWQISDLLLPPPQISMIHSLFVRGYFLPDKAKKTQRRTEEVVVEEVPDDSGGSAGGPGGGVGGRGDRGRTGIQHIFTPSSFKFRTPLLYTGMTGAIIKERSLQLEVCMTQKHTHRVFLMAMVHMPLRTALRRPIREKYPLIPCRNLTIPNNMRVYSATSLPTSNAAQDLKEDHSRSLAGKEAELEDDVSLSGDDFLRSHLSLCLEDESDDDSLAQSGSLGMTVSQSSTGAASGASSSSSNTLNVPSSDELNDTRYDDLADEEGSDLGDPNIRSTPLDGSLCEAGDLSASKKKIIPNELVQEDCDDADVNSTVVENGEERVPKSPEEAVLSDSVSPVPYTNGLNGSLSDDGELLSDKIPPQDSDHSGSPRSSATRKKILPASNTDISETSSESEEQCVRSPDLSQNGVFQNGAEEGQSPLPDKKPRNHSKNLPSSGQSRENSLGPGVSPSSLSPLADTGFSPASRPETPCWDFYDFSEDLQPEGDLEMGGQYLEQSLAQLRQQGIGNSLQNLSKEPILPMVLVDDFDTLTVDDES